MEIKNLKVGDKFYCLTQTGENEYKVLPHYVGALEANVYGETIKYVENGMILQENAKYCDTDFAKCAADVEASNQGYAVCAACGKAVESRDILTVGNVKICRDCFEILRDEASADRAEPENLRENVDGSFIGQEETEVVKKTSKKEKQWLDMVESGQKGLKREKNMFDMC